MTQILIVEDNDVLAENMSELLEGLGTGVVLVSDADAALEHAKRHGFHLAVVDVRLSGDPNGVDLIPELKGHAPDGEVILVTGNATLDSAVSAVGHGAFAYVLKPFSPEELVRLSERALAQVHLREERAALANELAASEALYRGVVDTAEALIVGIDRQGRVSFCNRWAAEISGRDVAESHGRPFDDICTTPDRRERLATAASRALDGEVVRDLQLPLVTKGGIHRTVRWTLTPLHTEGVSDPSVIAVGIDVTERLALLKRTVESEAMAAMGALTAGLAHEIRNPLNAAKLQLEVLSRSARKLEDEELRHRIDDRVEIVQTELSRLASLLNDFLSLARPRGIELQPVPLGQLLVEVVRLKRPLADVQRIDLTLDRPDDELKVMGDRGKLKQVMLNLVANALEAMRSQSEGSIAISVRTLPWGRVEIAVTDTGPGLEPEAEGQAFQPFVTTKDAGTGLGLTIVKKIVEMHDGEVALVNREDGESGAVARFTLPTR